MFRKWQFYFGANDYVEMTEELDSSMLASLGQRRRRRLLALLALVMALLVLAPWMAWNPTAFQWLSRVAPPVARFLRPDAPGQEDQGIRLEFVESHLEEDRLVIHLTMEDLQADRLNGSSFPEWWSYEQNDRRISGRCTREYDPQTGLLHLYLTCEAEEPSEFDWERWGVVSISGLRTTSDSVPEPVTIPLDPLPEPPIPIQEGRAITSVTLVKNALQVQVSEGEDPYSHPCLLYLRGPNGELRRHYSQSQSDGSTTWHFYLDHAELQKYTLVADLERTRTIGGTWTVHVKPATE